MTADDLDALKKEQEIVMKEARKRFIASQLPDFVVKGMGSFASSDGRFVIILYPEKVRICIYNDEQKGFIWTMEENILNVQKTVRFLQSFCK
jgi:hypothetical protein